MTPAARGPAQVTGEVLSLKRVGAYQHLTVLAPGVADRFRPGTLVALSVGGPLSDRLLRRSLPIFRARPSGGYGGTVEVVLPRETTDPGTAWLATLGAGDPVDAVGPLGRPYALPKEAVACTLVGEAADAAPLFSLAERLRERGCAVHMVLGANTGLEVFGALDAKRSAKTVVVATRDGSVGMRGTLPEVLPGLLARTASDVVYAAGPTPVLHAVARAAEEHGAWSQTAVGLGLVCATGACGTCVLPVVGEDGVTRMVRGCVEGPVFRGDRVRWDDLGTVPTNARGASSEGDAE
jgi:dihydroorotate dehydrogenase electron transfer subunit